MFDLTQLGWGAEYCSLHMRLQSILVLSLAFGCSRDLSLPSANHLSLKLPFDVVAPREQLTLEAVGGSGSGYTFSFAPGGQRSGGRSTKAAPIKLVSAGSRRTWCVSSTRLETSLMR